MGTYYDDYFSSNDKARPENNQEQRPAHILQGARGKVTSRPSRESILQSYAAQDAQRAREARMYSQAVSQVYQESSRRTSDRAAQREALAASQREAEARYAAERAARRESQQHLQDQEGAQGNTQRRSRKRVVAPLSTQESYDRTRSSMENYERARASRDALSEARRGRTTNREVIDGRGSIDSRAFNETHELVGYSIDDRDRPQALVDDSFTQNRWRSRAGQGFSDVPDASASKRPSPRRSPTSNIGFSGGVMSGRANYTAPRRGLRDIPFPLIIGAVALIILVIILLFTFVF